MQSKRQPNHLWLPSLIVVLVILVGITFSLARLMAAPTVTLSLVPSTLTMAPGETITVTIEVQAGAEPIDGVAAFLDFDPTRFQVSEVSPSTTLPFELVNRFENTLGTLDLVRGALTQPFPSGTFTLATFQLRAMEVPGTSTLSFNQGVPAIERQSDVTSGGVSVLGSVGSLTVEITDASSPTPTRTPTESPTNTPISTPTPTTIVPYPTPTVPKSWRVFIPSVSKNTSAIGNADFTPPIGARPLTIWQTLDYVQLNWDDEPDRADGLRFS